MKVIIRAWKNYLLQRKYRNILEDFRRKVYHKTIKKYIDNRMEIFNDIKEIQFDMTSNDKSVEYLKKRVKLIETFEAQGMRSLCRVFFFDFCNVILFIILIISILIASVRAKNVKLEMASLKVEDFERGLLISLIY